MTHGQRLGQRAAERVHVDPNRTVKAVFQQRAQRHTAPAEVFADFHPAGFWIDHGCNGDADSLNIAVLCFTAQNLFFEKPGKHLDP